MSFRSLLYLSLFAFFFLSCAGKRLIINSAGSTVEQPPKETPEFTIYAIGDAGLDNQQSRAVIEQLANMAADDSHPGMVLFLGDNIYPAGFASPSDSLAHTESRNLLIRQTEALKSFGGQILFIPGNHDWNEFNAGGLEAIRRQGDFLKNLNDPRIRLLPEKGCAGPEVLQLTEDAVMLIMDSQWWIQDWRKEPGINEGCEVQSKDDLIRAFHSLIHEHRDKQILVAMHHPLHTQGHHGGYFTFRDHFFPLTKVVKWLWVPLPVLGSIYPWYRSVIGHPQDIRNPRYKSLKKAILDELDYHGEMVFLAGHDHNLQYSKAMDHHHLLSGAGAKQNHVANGRNLIYGHKAAGFMTLRFYPDRSIQLTVYEVDPDSGAHFIPFRKSIVSGKGRE